MSDFCEDYPQLEPVQRERFRRVVTRLLAGEVMHPGPALQPEPDWRFAERFKDLIDAYLRIGGWRFDFDAGLRLGRAVHVNGEQRVRFNKLESTVVCLLRLAWHESMRAADDDVRCALKVGDVKERLIQAGRPAQQLSRRALADALRRLERHAIVTLKRGFAGDDADDVVVNPVIESILSTDRIAEIAALLKSYARRGGADADADADEPGTEAAGADE